jgi:hypothetical protein
VFVDRAQGKTPVFRTEKRRHADGDLSVDCENDRCGESSRCGLICRRRAATTRKDAPLISTILADTTTIKSFSVTGLPACA